MHTAKNTFNDEVVIMLNSPALNTLIKIVSGNINFIKPKEATRASNMAILFPRFKALCTVFTSAFEFSPTLTKKQPF